MAHGDLFMLQRELRRVPMDFDAPVGKTWAPLLESPDWMQFPACPTCGPATAALRGGFGTDHHGKPNGDGLTPEARQLEVTWYAMFDGATRQEREAIAWRDKLGQPEVDALVKAGRFDPVINCPKGCKRPEERGVQQGEDWHTDCEACEGRGWTREKLLPGAVLATELNRKARESIDIHDAINRGIAIQARCELLGLEDTCQTCHGHGNIATDDLRKKAEEWEPPSPPKGDGYQLWQTVSEGGPASPVFVSELALARWLQDNHTVASQRFSAEEWLQIMEGTKIVMEVGSGDLK